MQNTATGNSCFLALVMKEVLLVVGWQKEIVIISLESISPNPAQVGHCGLFVCFVFYQRRRRTKGKREDGSSSVAIWADRLGGDRRPGLGNWRNRKCPSLSEVTHPVTSPNFRSADPAQTRQTEITGCAQNHDSCPHHRNPTGRKRCVLACSKVSPGISDLCSSSLFVILRSNRCPGKALRRSGKRKAFCPEHSQHLCTFQWFSYPFHRTVIKNSMTLTCAHWYSQVPHMQLPFQE